MKIRYKSLALVVALGSILSISACQKFGEGTHETWVVPPEKGVVTDNTLTATVKAALLADPELRGLDLRVEVHNGEIMLSGLASNQSQIDRANTLAWLAEGVKKVDNRMSSK